MKSVNIKFSGDEFKEGFIGDLEGEDVSVLSSMEYGRFEIIDESLSKEYNLFLNKFMVSPKLLHDGDNVKIVESFRSIGINIPIIFIRSSTLSVRKKCKELRDIGLKPQTAEMFIEDMNRNLDDFKNKIYVLGLDFLNGKDSTNINIWLKYVINNSSIVCVDTEDLLFARKYIGYINNLLNNTDKVFIETKFNEAYKVVKEIKLIKRNLFLDEETFKSKFTKFVTEKGKKKKVFKPTVDEVISKYRYFIFRFE